jgi:uncharacterized protein YegP (UPF0339 family)
MGREKVELRPSRNGEWYFVLVHGNGEDGPVSETYTRKWNAKRAAARDYPDKPITVQVA